MVYGCICVCVCCMYMFCDNEVGVVYIYIYIYIYILLYSECVLCIYFLDMSVVCGYTYVLYYLCGQCI